MPETLTGSRVVDVVLWLASVVGAVTVIGGALWWLVWPRVEDKLQEVIRGVTGVREQLDPERPDTAARHARVAAAATAELPAIRAELAQLGRAQIDVERWRADVDRRLGGVEQVMVALAGPELARRLFEQLRDQLPPDDPMRGGEKP